MTKLSIAQLDQRVSSGTLFDVYRGRDEERGALVAVKLVRRKESLPPRQLAEALREEELVADAVGYDGLISGSQVQLHGDRPYQVSRWIEGISLADLLLSVPEHGALASTTAALIVLDLLDALAALHALSHVSDGASFKGPVYGDLNPDHVLVDAGGTVWLLPPRCSPSRWNVWKSLPSTVGDTTRHFLSPEAARFVFKDGRLAEIDRRSDIYAAGLILYYLANGSSPAAEFGDAEVIRSAINRPLLLEESKVRADPLLRDIQRVISDATSQSPDRRFATAQAMRKDLEAVVPSAGRARRTLRDRLASISTATSLGGDVAPPPAPVPQQRRHRRSTRPEDAATLQVDRPPGSLDAPNQARSIITPISGTKLRGRSHTVAEPEASDDRRSSDTQQLDPTEPSMLIDSRYRLKTHLWLDGIGGWWEAFDERLERPALVQSVSTDEPEGRRLREAAREHATLFHPSILPLYDIGQAAGHAYAVYQHVKAKPIALHDLEPMPLERLDKVARVLLDALVHAHEQEPPVPHGMFNDRQVLLTGDADAWILGFRGRTKLTSVRSVDTSRFFSPRLMRASRRSAVTPTPSDDVYSIGVLLWELAAGRRVIGTETAKNSMKLIIALDEQEIGSDGAANPELPDAVNSVLRRMIDKKENQRFTTARGALQAWTDAVEQGASSRMDAPARLQTGTVLSEKYELIRKLGSGGMAHVWLAKNMRLDSLVAIKVMQEKRAVNRKARVRFETEGRIQSNLIHPNVIRVFDVDVIPGLGLPYMVMAYIRGQSLYDWMVTHEGPRKPHEILPWMIQVLDALAAGHTHLFEIYHRDVKPENVMLDEHGNALLGDFGIAAVVDRQSTSMEVHPMTIIYAAPERVRGETRGRDAMSDIYSVGVMIWELLVGQHPIPQDLWLDSPQLLRHIMETQIPHIRSKKKSVDDDLANLVAAMTAFDPGKRFQSAAAAANAVRAYCDAHGIAAPPLLGRV